MMNRKKITAFLTSLLLMGASVPAQGLMTANAESYDYLEYWITGYYDENGYQQCIEIESIDDSFSGDLVIPSEIGGLPVKKIGYRAFADCEGLTSVTIPDSVNYIGWYAFRDCSNLTSVDMPNHISEIDEGAFQDCTSLTSVTIPASVEYIGDRAFEHTDLTSVTIPENVKSIGYCAFAGSSLASVEILGSETTIGGFAFDACENLTELNISENNQYYSFENGVLYDKDKTVLKQYFTTNSAAEFTVPDSVTTIAGWAFDGNPYLTSVTVPDSVEKIAIYAFDHCPNLTEINISENNPYYCFENGVLYDKDKTALKQYLANSSATEFVIPETVTSIAGYAFENAQNLTSITIPETVDSIGNYAFSGCTGLTSLKLPENVNYLGRGVFSDCTALSEVNIPTNLQYLNDHTFENCQSLASVTIPDSVIYIGWEAFIGSGLESVVIPSNVASVSSATFADCVNLRSVDFPQNLEYIDGEAFRGCSALTSVVIPDTVSDIGWNAFADCSALESVHLPAGLDRYLESGIFQNCTSLTSVEIPESVTWIGSNAFDGCTSLSYVYIPAGVEYICYQVFDNCTSLTNLDIASDNAAYLSEGGALFDKNKTVLKQYFMGNTESEYTVPDTVTSIGGQAFAACSNLTSVTIPANVRNIAFNAFYSSEATINGYENTAAQAHAEKNNYPFVSLGEAPVQEHEIGDATGEGDINILDVITVNKAVMGKENLTDAQLKAVDFNANGKPDSEEALTILKYIVGLVTSLTE